MMAIAALGSLGFAWSPPAQAQEEPAEHEFVIRVYLCERVPVSVGIAMASDPDGCVRLDGVEIQVAALDGQPIATCTTGQIRPTWGDCVVLAPYDTQVVVTQDSTTLPAGYQPRQNPIVTRNYTEYASAIFVNLPVVETNATPVPPITLPNTGTGPSPKLPLPQAIVMVALLAATTLAIAAGRRVRAA